MCTQDISGDPYYIQERLRAIDPEYFLVRKPNGTIELHHGKCLPTYQSTLPYDRLDARTLVWVRRTQSHRADALLADMQKAEAARG